MRIPEDKFLHAFVSIVATLMCSIGFIFLRYYCIIVGGMFTLGLGLGKEYGDKNATGNHWCWWDILADVIGILIGCGLAFILVRIRYGR